MKLLRQKPLSEVFERVLEAPGRRDDDSYVRVGCQPGFEKRQQLECATRSRMDNTVEVEKEKRKW
jgi:hypothetical protein